MTNEQINIAIAEACGWTDITLRPHDMGELPPRLVGFHKETGERKFLPNYCGDLNAMHEAEMCIPEGRQALYDLHLSAIVVRETGEMPNLQFRCIHASAKQRAKAFLRLFGKWEESK